MQAHINSLPVSEVHDIAVRGAVKVVNSLQLLYRMVEEQEEEVEKWKSEAAKLNSEYDKLKAACEKEKQDLRNTFKSKVKLVNTLRLLKKKEVEKWKSEAAKLNSENDELKAACQREKQDLRATFKRQTDELKAAYGKETEDLRGTFKRQTNELQAANLKEKEDLRSTFKRQTEELKAANQKAKEDLRAAFNRQTEKLKAAYQKENTEDLRAAFKRQIEELKAANQKENEELKAAFNRQTTVMHDLRYSLSLEQSHVEILSKKNKKLEARKAKLIDEYRRSEEFGHEVFYYAHLHADSAHSVWYAEALKDAKEKYPNIELSDFPLFNPNAGQESVLKLLIDEVGWRPSEGRAASMADKAEASGSKPAVDNH